MNKKQAKIEALWLAVGVLGRTAMNNLLSEHEEQVQVEFNAILHQLREEAESGTTRTSRRLAKMEE